jgi:hypothetical protein
MVSKSVAEILEKHVTFELEAIDRMYLNAYVPSLQTGAGFVYFAKTQLGARVPSTTVVAPMSGRFVAALEQFAATEGVGLVTFEKGQRKDDVAQQYLARFDREEGLVFIGKAQEKAHVFRTEKRRDAAGKRYPSVVRSTICPLCGRSASPPTDGSVSTAATPCLHRIHLVTPLGGPHQRPPRTAHPASGHAACRLDVGDGRDRTARTRRATAARSPVA